MLPSLPAFAGELPYGVVLDAERGICLLETPRSPKPRLSLGCAWRVIPVNTEVMDESACLALGRQHEQLLRGLPLGSLLQTIMSIAPSVEAPAWEGVRERLPANPVLTAQREAIAAGLPHTAGTMHAHLRTITTLVTLRVPLEELDPTLLTTLKALCSLPRAAGHACAAQLNGALVRALERFAGLRLGIEDTLRGIGHQVVTLDGEGLGQGLASALAPLSVGPAPLLLPDQALRTQVLAGEAESIPGGWRFGTTEAMTGDFQEQYRAQILSLHRVTNQTYPGMLCAARAPKESKPLALWDAWDGPLTVVVNAAVVDEAVEERKLTTKKIIAAWQSWFSPRNKAIAAQIEELLTQRFLTGSTMALARVHVVVWGREDTVARGVEDVQRAARGLRMALTPEPTLGSTLLLHTLPLGCDPGFPPEWALNRGRRMDIGNLAHLLTLYGAFGGTKTASVLYVNQRGEATTVNPFDNQTNPHVIIAGTSGAGKTYNVGYYLNQILPLGAMAVILDPLRNYRGLCEYWEGEHITLDPNAPLFLNPFLGPLDTAHVNFLANNLAEMASGGIEGRVWQEFTVLGLALTHFARTWDRGRGEPILSHFIHEVLEEGCYTKDRQSMIIGRTVARKLGLFYGDGMFAGFVDGPNAFTFTSPLTLIEFAEVKNEDLRGILFFSLFHLITRRFEDPSLHGIWKTIIGDELWSLLKHKSSAEVIEKIVRTYRNIQSSAVFLSQRAEDFASPVGAVIRGIAETVLFLKQTSGEMTQLQKLFELSEAEIQMFDHVQRHQGWSSGFLRLGHGDGGIVRTVPDMATHVMMAQSEDMRIKRDQLRKQYGSLRKGIEAVVHG